MSTSFQPDNPHPDTDGPARWTTIVLLSILSALMVVMILGVLAPRLFQQSSTSWAVTLSAGAATLLVGLGAGYWHRTQ
jgi:TRAP-type C4-dicarboxylate transport system permease small subunit